MNLAEKHCGERIAVSWHGDTSNTFLNDANMPFDHIRMAEFEDGEQEFCEGGPDSVVNLFSMPMLVTDCSSGCVLF